MIVSRAHHVTAPSEGNQHSGYKTETGNLYHPQYAYFDLGRSGVANPSPISNSDAPAAPVEQVEEEMRL